MPQDDLAAFTAPPGSGPTVTLRPGEFLFREGDEADALFIVTRGTLRIISGSVLYEVVQVGGIVGEMAIVEQGIPRSASVIAGTYAELIKVGAADFLALIETTPEFALKVMQVMARRLRLMNQRYRPQAHSW
jgi:CRP/FNR family cyclic AMP-dependent transcriptional regulator